MTTAESNLAQASSEEDSDETNTEAMVRAIVFQLADTVVASKFCEGEGEGD